MSGIGFGSLLLAIFIREGLNEMFLNPWKIVEQMRSGVKETKAEKAVKEKPTGKKENMTAERAAYESEKAEYTRLQAEQKESSKRDLVS